MTSEYNMKSLIVSMRRLFSTRATVVCDLSKALASFVWLIFDLLRSAFKYVASCSRIHFSIWRARLLVLFVLPMTKEAPS